MDPRLREDDVIKLPWLSNPTISVQLIFHPVFCNTLLRGDDVVMLPWSSHQTISAQSIVRPAFCYTLEGGGHSAPTFTAIKNKDLALR
jgi:hypothetical protein